MKEGGKTAAHWIKDVCINIFQDFQKDFFFDVRNDFFNNICNCLWVFDYSGR